jgi:hypothetical protein
LTIHHRWPPPHVRRAAHPYPYTATGTGKIRFPTADGDATLTIHHWWPPPHVRHAAHPYPYTATGRGKIHFPRFVLSISLLCSTIAVRYSAATVPLAVAPHAPSHGHLRAPPTCRQLTSLSSFQPLWFRVPIVHRVAAAAAVGTSMPTAMTDQGDVPPSMPRAPHWLHITRRPNHRGPRPLVRATRAKP